MTITTQRPYLPRVVHTLYTHKLFSLSSRHGGSSSSICGLGNVEKSLGSSYRANVSGYKQRLKIVHSIIQ